jgi:hypothetical protein
MISAGMPPIRGAAECYDLSDALKKCPQSAGRTCEFRLFLFVSAYLIESVASWRDICTEFRSIWPDIEHLVPTPEYEAGPRRPREYTARLTFEAFLKVIWQSRPLRKSFGPPYPPATSLHRDLSYWFQKRALQKLVREYVKRVSHDVYETWLDRVSNESSNRGQYRLAPRQAAQRRNAYWMIVFRNALEKEGKRR